jgi:hypothetical protein
MKRAALLAAVLSAAISGGVLSSPVRAAQDNRVVGLLDIERGYVFTTAGETFTAVPNLQLTGLTGAALKTIAPGTTVRLTFDADGAVSAVTIVASANTSTAVTKVAAVTFIVRVPATTYPTDQVYITTNQSGWDALAIRMDRVDPLHFRAIVGVPVGGTLRYLYTRGNSPTIERGADGLTRHPRSTDVLDDTPRTIYDNVEHWGDEAGNTTLPAPQATPTPFNPAPFPNLPNFPPARGRQP